MSQQTDLKTWNWKLQDSWPWQWTREIRFIHCLPSAQSSSDLTVCKGTWPCPSTASGDLAFEMSSGKAIGIQYSSFSVSCDFIWFSFFLITDLTFLPPPHCFISHIWNGLIFTLFPAPLLSFYYKLSPVSSYFCVFFKTFMYFPIHRQHFL